MFRSNFFFLHTHRTVWSPEHEFPAVGYWEYSRSSNSYLGVRIIICPPVRNNLNLPKPKTNSAKSTVELFPGSALLTLDALAVCFQPEHRNNRP